MMETPRTPFPHAAWAISGGLVLATLSFLLALVPALITSLWLSQESSLLKHLTHSIPQSNGGNAVMFGWAVAAAIWLCQRVLGMYVPAHPGRFFAALLVVGTPLAIGLNALTQSILVSMFFTNLQGAYLPETLTINIQGSCILIVQILAALLAASASVWAGGNRPDGGANKLGAGGYLLQTATLALGMVFALQPGAITLAILLLPSDAISEMLIFYPWLETLALAAAALTLALWPHGMRHATSTVLCGLGMLMTGLPELLWVPLKALYDYAQYSDWAWLPQISKYPYLLSTLVLALIFIGGASVATVAGYLTAVRGTRQRST